MFPQVSIRVAFLCVLVAAGDGEGRGLKKEPHTGHVQYKSQKVDRQCLAIMAAATTHHSFNSWPRITTTWPILSTCSGRRLEPTFVSGFGSRLAGLAQGQTGSVDLIPWFDRREVFGHWAGKSAAARVGLRKARRGRRSFHFICQLPLASLPDLQKQDAHRTTSK